MGSPRSIATTNQSKAGAKPSSMDIGGLINGQYEVVGILGFGGFGAVFKVVDVKSKHHYALKYEMQKPKEDEAGVELEVGVMKLLQCSAHFLQYIDSGKIDGNDFVIMQLAGRNLADLRKSCPKNSFTLNTTIRLAEQTMEAIEAMHASRLIHRDIKPANFAIGYHDREARNIFLLDFGLVRQFRLKDGKLRAARLRMGFKGTLKYASINCHKNLDLGRHDDLCSWLYMIIEFTKGELPWQAETDKNKVLEMKEKTKNQLLENTEPEFKQIYDSLLSLKFADEPPYHTYRCRLYEVMQRKGIKSNDIFDWEQGGAFYKEATKVEENPYKKHFRAREKLIKEKEKDTTDAVPIPK